jgi:hypothetical protein
MNKTTHPAFPGIHVRLGGVMHEKPTRAEIKKDREKRMLRINKFPSHRKVQKQGEATIIQKFVDDRDRELARKSNGQIIRTDGVRKIKRTGKKLRRLSRK